MHCPVPVSWPTHFHVSLQNAVISLDISMKRQNDAILRQMERISILSTGYICSICWQFTCSLSLRETKYSYFSIRIIDKEFSGGESRLNSFSLLSQIAWIISFFRWNVYCTILYAFSSELLTIFHLFWLTIFAISINYCIMKVIWIKLNNSVYVRVIFVIKFAVAIKNRVLWIYRRAVSSIWDEGKISHFIKKILYSLILV